MNTNKAKCLNFKKEKKKKNRDNNGTEQLL